MIVKRRKDIHWICFIAGKYSVWYNHGSLTGVCGAERFYMEKNTKDKKWLKITGAVCSFIVITVAVLICFSIKWMFDTWTNLSMEELVYHLTAPLEGTNEEMIWQYVRVCVLPTILIMAGISALVVFGCKKEKPYWRVIAGAVVISVLAQTYSVYGAWKKLDIGGYMANQGEVSTFIDDNYVDPRSVELTFPEQKRNLIYIFLESMETTYADTENGGAFEKNVIPELTTLAQENEDFSGKDDTTLNGGYSMPGTTWTMGAMFGQTSGLPLNISIDANDMDTQDNFFPEIITIGDILESAGYSQTLMIGSDATFGGRRNYFTQHGNYNIKDYNYAIEQGWIPEDYKVWWGYEDRKLFDYAKEELQNLAAGSEPFNLTLLTVDTHFEDGYPCEICPTTYGDNQYANVMACSSKQVDEFVKWIQQQDFYENTTIVISGDHPTMDSDFCEDVDEDYTRKVYITYINAEEDALSSRRVYTTFDNFPTTLGALGVQIEGDRLGLGTNLFSSTQTLVERYGIDMEESELKKKSELIDKLADIDENSEELLLRQGKVPTGEIAVGEYDYHTAALPVIVYNIANDDSIASVTAAVWHNEDQSDLQWVELPQNEDGTYSTNVNIANFNFVLGEYHIHVYALNTDGQQYFLGEGIGNVQ